MLAHLPIDWSKPHLRLVYLVEGVFRDHGGDERKVRWCGPPERTGSGFVAYPTFGISGKGLPPLVSWEARLSRCSYDATLGTLKQHIMALSDVSLRVALGDDDVNSVSELRDMALIGRWMGQDARLILVDADEVERFEIVADGTWDRDPDKLGPSSFQMKIDVGDIIPPTLDWEQGQVPDTVSQWQTQSYTASTWIQSPNGSGSPAFRLNPEHKGKWVGELFGGAVHQSIQTEQVWREIVPYGVTSTQDFAWVSPRLDQFLYDIVVETDAGLVVVGDDAALSIRVFNNINPLIGPVGTCVVFGHPADFYWAEKSHRAFAKVAGGHPLVRPSGYSDIGPSGDPELGSNIPGGGEAAPTSTTLNPSRYSNAVGIFEDLISAPHFLDSPDRMHPDASVHLTSMSTFFGLPWERRQATVPVDLGKKQLPFREVIESLMRSFPADLLLKRDGAARRKYFAQIRQQAGQPAAHTITAADLMMADKPSDVTHLDNPDGYYSNEVSLVNSEFLYEPVLSSGHEVLDPKTYDNAQIEDLLEQSSTKTGRVVSSEVTLNYWRFEDSDAFKEWARSVESKKSQPQKTIEAVHGFRSMRLELGELIQYSIPGVLSWVGQIRSMRFDLDRQTVRVRSYHQPPEPRVEDTSSTINDKAHNEAEGRVPVIDRRRD